MAFQMFHVALAICSDVWTCCEPWRPERLSPARAAQAARPCPREISGSDGDAHLTKCLNTLKPLMPHLSSRMSAWTQMAPSHPIASLPASPGKGTITPSALCRF